MSPDYLSITDPYHIASTAAAMHSAHAAHGTEGARGSQSANPSETSPLETNPDAEAANLNQMLTPVQTASAAAAAPASVAASETSRAEPVHKTVAEIAKEVELLEYLDETPDSQAAHAEVEGAAFGNGPAVNNPAATTSNTGPAGFGSPASSTMPSEQEVKLAYTEAAILNDQALINAGVLSPNPTSTGTDLKDILDSEMELAAEHEAAAVAPQPPLHHVNLEA